MARSLALTALNSTIVRSLKLPLYERAALAAVRMLGRIAPAAAARAAKRLFLTPPRFRAPEREREILARARAGSVRAGGRRIAMWSWGAGPRVLLVHGWGGRGGQLGAFVEPLLALGFSVTAFDGPAHGASEGRAVTIPEMAEALRDVLAAAGPVHGIVAHSGGGAVSAWALHRALLAGFVELPAAIALVAPATDFRGYLEHFMEACGLSAVARRRLEQGLERRVGLPPEAFDLRRFAAHLPLAALVVHDREDTEIPWADGAEIAAAWPGAELITTHGLGHRRILRDPAVVTRVTGFLAARLERDRTEEPSTVAVLC